MESHILYHQTTDGLIKYFLKVKNRSDYQIFEEVLIFPNFKMIEESTLVDTFKCLNCYTIKKLKLIENGNSFLARLLALT